eukprot:9477720-Pyramimonas_sp.AAC.1
MRSGLNDDGGGIDPKILNSVDAALKFDHLLGFTWVLVSITSIIGKCGTWAEGCRCHEHLLFTGGVYNQANLSQYRKQSQGCFMKGRRLIELVCGGADRFCSRLMRGVHSKFQEYLALLAPQNRA